MYSNHCVYVCMHVCMHNIQGYKHSIYSSYLHTYTHTCTILFQINFQMWLVAIVINIHRLCHTHYIAAAEAVLLFCSMSISSLECIITRAWSGSGGCTTGEEEGLLSDDLPPTAPYMSSLLGAELGSVSVSSNGVRSALLMDVGRALLETLLLHSGHVLFHLCNHSSTHLGWYTRAWNNIVSVPPSSSLYHSYRGNMVALSCTPSPWSLPSILDKCGISLSWSGTSFLGADWPAILLDCVIAILWLTTETKNKNN